MKKKILTTLALIMCAVLLTVGTTLAWLTAQTPSIENEFTVGNINIHLNETTGNEYKLIPGADTAKDPKVTVDPQSEACYLYIKVEKSANLDDFIEYSLDGWTALDGVNDVYYREVAAEDAANGIEYPVLTGNKVTAKTTITKEMVDDLTDSTLPTMTFTAYAVQSVGFDNAAAAWSATFGASN